MKLTKENLRNITSPSVRLPGANTFDLPEKVLQFGTGVLLRGLPEFFIDKANNAGFFHGRVVIVKSTTKGTTSDFDTQDSLYTIAVRGIENGQKSEENIISSAISRVINAPTEWDEVLAIARSKDLEIIISNTTEAGIQLTDDSVQASPPVSFPGKLLAVLYERYRYFDGAEDRGLIILPTELISNNGSVLKAIVIALAKQNLLDEKFIDWLDRANSFCNSLVDRIVPGKPDDQILSELNQRLGYDDELLIVAETYRLWAIEGDDRIKDMLTFQQADKGVIIAPDITMFKELKLRLLNGSHTLTCATAMLGGFDTVHQAMNDDQFSKFITDLLEEDLTKSIPYAVSLEDAMEFAGQVLDRFRNPFIRHYWLSISTNYTLKLKLRVVPMLLQYYKKFGSVPEHISFGFGAYILLMQSEERTGNFYSLYDDKGYKIDDEFARYYCELWHSAKTLDEVVIKSLSNVQIWEEDLSILPGFANRVKECMGAIKEEGMFEALKKINTTRIHFNETE